MFMLPSANHKSSSMVPLKALFGSADWITEISFFFFFFYISTFQTYKLTKGKRLWNQTTKEHPELVQHCTKDQCHRLME